MKNLLVIAVLSIFGFASCEQIEVVEPTTNLENESYDNTVEVVKDISINEPSCDRCINEIEIVKETENIK